MANFLNLNTYQQISYICQNIQLIIAVIGIVGNILAFIVFSRSNLKKHSYSFYCRVMATTDIGLLICYIRNWASNILDANLNIVAPFFCSMNMFLSYFFGGLSLSMLTLISSDRMIAIVYSNRFKFIKKRWFQWLMVAVGIVFNVGINIMPAITNRLVEIVQSTNSSIKICASDSRITEIQSWIFFGNFLLFTILINNILNVKMVWFIVSSRRKVARNLSNVRNSVVRDRKFAITSIGLNLTCMVLKLPFAIFLIIKNKKVISFDVLIAIQMIVLSISVLDNGFSFLINFFVNSIFHDEFLVLIGIKKRNVNSSQNAEPITSVNSRK